MVDALHKQIKDLCAIINIGPLFMFILHLWKESPVFFFCTTAHTVVVHFFPK